MRAPSGKPHKLYFATFGQLRSVELLASVHSYQTNLSATARA